MAVKVTSKRKIKSFDVGANDEALNEVLSAGKTNLVYKNGEVLPDVTPVIEDEPLIIEENPVVSYEAVHERAVQYAKDHEDPKVRLENKKKSRRLTGRRLFETIVSIGLIILLGFFVMLLLNPQTELSELARDNSNLKDQINTIKREIVNGIDEDEVNDSKDALADYYAAHPEK